MQTPTENTSQITPSTPESNKRECDFPLMGPGSLVLLTLVAGPLVAAAAASSVMARLNRKKIGRIIMLLMTIITPVFYLFLVLWPVKWYWSSLTLLLVHIVCATALFLFMRKYYLQLPDSYLTHFSTGRRQNKGYIVAGILGGSALSLVFGLSAIVLFLLFSDYLFATLVPVAFSDAQSLSLLGTSLFCLAISGAIAGGYLGKVSLKLNPVNMILYTLVLIWIALTWLFAMQLTISIPGFQAGQAGDSQWTAALFPFVGGNLLVGIWWIPFLMIYLLKPSTLLGRCKRFLQIPFINCSAALVLAILLGYPGNWFYSGGHYFEQQAKIPSALWCYEQGLNKEPSAETASYLQYRMAILAHKLGQHERAVEGFRKVVSKYNYHENLVKKSSRFLDSLERSNSVNKRVVLPGVETSTAYKGAYCVPNSLALVMNYWGAEVDAESIGSAITGLGSGTMIVDQAWYAAQNGFHHDFLPIASIKDIKSSIDAGFPVLVYVPAHIFVIVGYDEILETFVTYDVATKDVWVDYIQKDFIKSWKRQNMTMVLVYPPSEADRVPASIHEKLVNLSDSYLHYHLYYLDAPKGYASSDHLLRAVDKKGVFFQPLTILYQDFPGLRPTLAGQFDTEHQGKEIYTYFGKDFNEGHHLWGQNHYENYASKDDMLEYSLSYLIARQQLPLARDLIDQIEENGPVSQKTLETRAMIDMALGDLESGIRRLNEKEDDDLNLYLGQAQLTLGNNEAAIQSLVDIVDDCT